MDKKAKKYIRVIKMQCMKVIKKNKCKMLAGLATLSIYMVVHSFSVPALGIVLELQKRSDCVAYVHEFHVLYWLLDVVRYAYDIVVRLLMILTTIAIGGIWSDDDNITEEDSFTSEPKDYSDYLKDRKATNEDHVKRAEDYTQKGDQVKRIMDIFQAWFIVPWIMFSVGSALDTDRILRAWKKTRPDTGYDLADTAYLVYNLNQLSLLAVAYTCAKCMNLKHLKYFIKLRERQIARFKTASRKALANLLRIEKDSSFDFLPCIWGTNVKIQVDDPFYIILLLLNIISTVIVELS